MNAPANSPQADPKALPLTTLEWARFYYSLGWSVVPVRPGEKLPALAWKKYQTKRPNLEQIDRWWGKGGLYEDCGIALITGQVSGIFVIDIDVNDGKVGQESFDDLCTANTDLSETPTSLTGGGGKHIILKAPDGVRTKSAANTLGTHLDTRGDGGLIVLPPSVHESGRQYEWETGSSPKDVRLKPTPGWLIPMVRNDIHAVAVRHDYVAGTNTGGEITTDQFGRVIDGRDTYLRNIIWASVIDFAKKHGRIPSVEEVFDHCKATFEAGAKAVGDSLEADRFTPELFRRKIKSTLRKEKQIMAEAAKGQAPMVTAVNDDWPELEDPFGKFLPPPFPASLLPPVMQDWVEQEALLSGADPAGYAAGLLAVIGSSMPDKWRLQPKKRDSGWAERACLWVMFVGAPSSMKSPILASVTKPLWLVENAFFKIYQDEFNLADIDKDKNADDVPQARRLIIQDMTPEAALNIMRENPNGLLASVDELSSLIDGIDRYNGSGKGGGGRQMMLTSFNGGPVHVDRVNRAAGRVENASMAIVGTIQDDVVRKSANSYAEDGMFARFLPVTLAPPVFGGDFERDETVVNIINDMVSAFANSNSGLGLPNFRFDDEAQLIMDDHRRYIHTLTAYETYSPRLAAWCGKLMAQTTRIALILHHIKHGGPHAPRRVTAQTTVEAIRLVKEFFIPHAIRFFVEVLDETVTDELARAAANLILHKRYDRIQNRDLSIQSSPLRKLDFPKRRAAMEILEAYGWVKPEDPNDPFCKTWVINPEVHVRFASRARLESDQRGARNELIQADAALRRSEKANRND